MMVDTIITLDNNLNYLLLDETMLDNRKLFFATKVDENLSKPTNEYLFIEEINRNGEVYAKVVKDKELIKYLSTVFTSNYLDNVEEGLLN